MCLVIRKFFLSLVAPKRLKNINEATIVLHAINMHASYFSEYIYLPATFSVFIQLAITIISVLICIVAGRMFRM